MLASLWTKTTYDSIPSLLETTSSKCDLKFVHVQVCTLLRQLTRGSLFGGQSCNSDINRGCCPLACSEPTLFGINNIFSVCVNKCVSHYV